MTTKGEITSSSFITRAGDEGAWSGVLNVSVSPPQILDVRNVAVVVSRWYGGVLLGPDRFKHINNCARSLLVEEGYAAASVRDARRHTSTSLLMGTSGSSFRPV